MFTLSVLEPGRPAYVLRGQRAMDFASLHDGDLLAGADMAVTDGRQYHAEIFRTYGGTLIMFWFPTDVLDEFAIGAVYKVLESVQRKERHASS